MSVDAPGGSRTRSARETGETERRRPTLAGLIAAMVRDVQRSGLAFALTLAGLVAASTTNPAVQRALELDGIVPRGPAQFVGGALLLIATAVLLYSYMRGVAGANQMALAGGRTLAALRFVNLYVAVMIAGISVAGALSAAIILSGDLLETLPLSAMEQEVLSYRILSLSVVLGPMLLLWPISLMFAGYPTGRRTGPITAWRLMAGYRWRLLAILIGVGLPLHVAAMALDGGLEGLPARRPIALELLASACVALADLVWATAAITIYGLLGLGDGSREREALAAVFD